MEQPAKRWEVAAISEQVKVANNKLDILINQPRITKEEVAEMIESRIKDVHAKYDPVYSAAKWFAGVLVVAVVGQVVYLWFQLTGGKT